MNTLENIIQRRLKSKITLTDYIHSIIVSTKIRATYLIQNFDTDDILVNQRIKSIQQLFKLNHLQEGTYNFISIKKLKSSQVSSNEKIGKLLGYGCNINFDDLDRNKPYYTYNIIMELQSDETLDLITYICQENSETELTYAESLKDSINSILSSDQFIKDYIKDVTLLVTENKPNNYLTDILLDLTHKFTESDIEEVDDMLYNAYSSFESLELISENLDYDNPIHRGILLCIKSRYDNDVLEPFYPLQNNPNYEIIKTNDEAQIKYLYEVLLKSQ